VGWKSAGQNDVSHAGALSLGGVYIHTKNPLTVGSTIELVFSVPNGYVRARAIVRRTIANKGMGVQFIQMGSEDRSKWNQFLLRQQQAPPEASPKVAAAGVSQPNPPASRPGPLAAQRLEEPANRVSFRQEVEELVAISQKGTLYELLNVTAESQASDIKRSYYSLAKKFHPDHHMDQAELVSPLQALMRAITEAYHTLRDERNRSVYDKALVTKGAFDLAREKTESLETFGDCMDRANECLRARNFVGSIVWLRKCVHIAPHDAKSHSLLARSLGTVPAYRNEAISHFQRAIELDPWNTGAYFHCGELYESMKLPWRASPLYSQILTIDPEHNGAHERLSAIKASEKRKAS
jgi:tetratricopeptide (TPR) repeat protein